MRFNSDWVGYDAEFEALASFDADAVDEPLGGMPFRISVGVGPYASVVLSQDE